jgi:hypothetical protein
MRNRDNPFGAHIDWHAWIREERVRRLLAIPLFMEAGSLFQSASRLWKGRFGQGRVRGAELASLGRQLMRRAQEWNHSTLGWADSPLKPAAPGEAVGPLIAQYRDDRSYHPCDPDDRGKHPMAARRLAMAAGMLVAGDLPAIRLTGDHLYADKEADRWEDELEKLEDSPCFEPPNPPSDASALIELGHRAFYRTCGDLAHTMAVTLANSTGSRREGASDELKTGIDRWYAYSAAFAEQGDSRFTRFVLSAPEDERAALKAKRDDACHYCHCLTHRNYAGDVELRRAAAVISALIEALLCFADLKPDCWDGGDLGPNRLPSREEFIRALTQPDKLLTD